MSLSFTGFVDGLSASCITGWLYNTNDIKESFDVELWIDDVLITTQKANKYRKDLYNEGIGTGNYAFTINIPQSLFICYNSAIILKEKIYGYVIPWYKTLRKENKEGCEHFVSIIEKRLSELSQEEIILLLEKSKLFNSTWYLNTFNDVKKHSFFQKYPLHHFIENGWREGRNPSLAFDVEKYVLQSGLYQQENPINPLLHYYAIGQYLYPCVNSAPAARGRSFSEIQALIKAKRLFQKNYQTFLNVIEKSNLFTQNVYKPEEDKSFISSNICVSVIMPCYNREISIRYSIESVLAQTWKQFQLIIIDDESTDNSLSQIGRYLFDPRITLVRIKHSGVCAARNIGLSQAIGEYVAFLDSDNLWNPRFLETMLARMGKEGCLAAYSGIQRISNKKSDYFFRTYCYQALLQENFIDLNSILIKRELLKNISFDEIIYRLNDWDFILHIADRVSFHSYNFIGVAYYNTPDTNRISDIKYHQKNYIINKRIPFVNWDQLQLTATERVKGLISIIIPFYTGEELTLACLRSILIHTTDVPYELILVDNGSSQETRTAILNYIAGMNNIIYIQNTYNVHFALGCNLGAAVSSGEYLCFLNNDTVVTPFWLKKLFDTIDANPQIGFVNPVCLYPDNTLQYVGVAYSMFSKIPYHIYTNTGWNDWEKNSSLFLKSRPLSSGYGACLMERAHDFFLMKGFHSAFLNGSEETYHTLSLCSYLNKKGVLVTDSKIFHHESKTPGRGLAISHNVVTFYKLLGSNIPQPDDINIYASDGLFPVQYVMGIKTKNIGYQYPFVENVKLAPRSLLTKENLTILIVKPSGIGNMLWTMPLVVVLKKLFPQAKINILCFQQEAIIAAKEANEVIILERSKEPHLWLEKFEKLASTLHYDLVLLPPHTISPTTPGLNNISEYILYHPWIDWSVKHEIEHSMDLARILGYKGKTPIWKYPVPNTPWPEKQKKAIVIHIGASDSGHMQKKCWPLSKWAALIRLLAETDKIFLVTGPNETKQNQALIELLEENVRKKVHKHTSDLDTLALLLIHSKCLITIDGGIGHLANHLDVPLVMIFGPTSAVKGFPLHNRSKTKVLTPHERIWCAPCYPSTNKLNLCQHQTCLHSITISQVIHALNELGVHVIEKIKDTSCPICGGKKFSRGPFNRLSSTGMLPVCQTCGSFERHRGLYKVYSQILPLSWIRDSKALQLSNDVSVKDIPFKEIEISIYNGENSLDLMEIDRPNESYDWVICNHVLEHIPDAIKAMEELFRILKENGILQLTFPNPYLQLVTMDWGKADESKHGHWRSFGVDFFEKLYENIPKGIQFYSCVMIDPVTQSEDICYFATKDNIKQEYFENSYLFKKINSFNPVKNS